MVTHLVLSLRQPSAHSCDAPPAVHIARVPLSYGPTSTINSVFHMCMICDVYRRQSAICPLLSTLRIAQRLVVAVRPACFRPRNLASPQGPSSRRTYGVNNNPTAMKATTIDPFPRPVSLLACWQQTCLFVPNGLLLSFLRRRSSLAHSCSA